MRQLLSKIKRSIRRASASESSNASADLKAPPRPNLVHNAPLEELPPEVRRCILFALDLDSQSALTHASPVYHQQYRQEPGLIKECMEHELHGVAVDACAVYQSGSAEFYEARTKEGVKSFLQNYHDSRNSSSLHYVSLTEGGEKETPTLDELTRMISFHKSIIKPLVRRFTRWALSNIARDCHRPSTLSIPLSQTEETRLIRAFYRLQLYCNLFGLRDTSNVRLCWDLEFEDTEILHILLSPFEPWEVEEIVCVASWVKNQVGIIFGSITWDVHPDHPRFDDQQHRPPTPIEAFDLTFHYNRDHWIRGVCCRGLGFLHTVINLKDHEKLVAAMQKAIGLNFNSFFGNDTFELLNETPQDCRCEQYPNDQDLMSFNRVPLPFRGDRMDSPPLAWTVMWRDTYSNYYAWWADKRIEFWGYVIWDAWRFERSGGKEYLLREMERWDDKDPRVWAFR